MKKKDIQEKVQQGNVQTGRRRKRKKWPIVLAVILVLFIVVRMAACGSGGKAQAVVTVSGPVRGELQESISTSGVVESEETRSYFAPVTGILGQVLVEAGDAVKSGEFLIGYDSEEAEREFKTASLQDTINSSTYESAMADHSKSSSRLNEANTNLAVLEQQIADYEAYLEKLEKQLEKNQRDTSKGLAEESFNLGSRAQQLHKEMEGLSPDSEEYRQKAAALAQVEAEQSRNSYLQQIAASASSDYELKMQEEIAEVTRNLNACKEYQAEMEAQKTASESAVLDSYQQKKYQADREMSSMSYNQAQEDYALASQGITAEFDAVVTECAAEEGASVAAGTKLLTLANSNAVKVSFSASKYDLEKLETGQRAQVTISGRVYEGEVSKIDRMATQNESGTPMVGAEIHLTAPDEHIILGIDARIEIFTHKAENALLIPVEAVNAGKEGDFLYVVENNVAVKRPVKCGISSDTYTEVLEGIDENTQVIISSYTALEEGMEVLAAPDMSIAPNVTATAE